MLIYPQINPVALQIGPLQVHWYGTMYLLGFLVAWALGCYRAKCSQGLWKVDEVADLLFYGAIGVILGGRIGYMLFYYYPAYGSEDPWALFKIWEGGMSFHGGFIGVMLALWLYGRKINKDFFTMADFTVPLVPLGIGAGRIGNFINGELWGRVTDVPWGMVFAHVDQYPRHPSQLYECILEGLLLFMLVWWYSSKSRPKMAVSGVFLIGYACARIISEFFRQPDQQLGFLFTHFTMGQLLSIPLLVLGIFFLWYAYHHNREINHSSKRVL